MKFEISNPKLKNNYQLLLIVVITLLFTYLLCFFICNNNSLTPDKIFCKNINGIVELKAYTEEYGESYGTAEFINHNGDLITNAHIVTYSKLGSIHTFNSFFIRFASDEEYVEVSLIKYDIELDLAVLKMNKSNHSFVPLKTDNSDNIKSGNKIYSIGNAANYGLSMAEGIIGMPLININYNGITKSVIQANINITDGNSGGALLNEKGNIIGITTFRTRDNHGNVIFGISYCIPINTVLEYIKK